MSTNILSLWSDFKPPPPVLLPIPGHPELGLEMRLGKNHPEVTASHVFSQVESHLKDSHEEKGKKYPKTWLDFFLFSSLSPRGLPKCRGVSAHPPPSIWPGNSYSSFRFPEASLCA